MIRCSECDQLFHPSRRHRTSCLDCVRRRRVRPQIDDALQRLDVASFDGRSDARANAYDVARRLIEHMHDVGRSWVLANDVPTIVGRDPRTTKRMLDRVASAGVVEYGTTRSGRRAVSLRVDGNDARRATTATVRPPRRGGERRRRSNGHRWRAAGERGIVNDFPSTRMDEGIAS